MYRTVESSFWTDPDVRQLSKDGRLLMLYLITGPHGHVGGIYHLSDTIIAAETGIAERSLDTLWDTLSGLGLSRRDKKTEVLWVVSMMKYQARGEKLARAVANHLKTLHKSFLITEFLEKYPHVKRFIKDTLSIPYPELGEVGTQEQEQKGICIVTPSGEYQSGILNRDVLGSSNSLGGEEKTDPTAADQIRAVFAHYRTYHPKSFKDPSPKSKEWGQIRSRLAEGSTVEDLCLAIDGNHRSPFHCGENERRTAYHSLDLIVRDGSKVGMFIGHATANAGPVLSDKTRRGLAAVESYAARMEEGDES